MAVLMQSAVVLIFIFSGAGNAGSATCAAQSDIGAGRSSGGSGASRESSSS